MIVIALLAALLSITSLAPNAPTGLTATVASATQINLAWTDTSDNENGFGVLRCQGSAECFDFGEIATLGPNATSFEDVGRTPGITYRYLIRAFNTDGNRYSNIAEATTPQIPPADPTALSASPAKHGFRNWVELSWTDNSNNESGFVLERCAGASCTDFGTIASVSAGVTAYRDATVSRRTTYQYRISATNSAGSSGYSNVAVTSIR